MHLSRRQLLKIAASMPALSLSACSTVEFGNQQSYLTQILESKNRNTVFDWLDVILQQIRDQRLTPPRAAYNLAMPMVAGFLAANGITQEFEEPYGIGTGPKKADPEVAYSVAFSIAAAEVFQQPFVFEKSRILRRYPSSESKSLGIEWGKRVGKMVVKMRNNDGAEPSEVNYYFENYPRRTDSLKWHPTGPFYSARPGAAFETFDRGLFPSHGKIQPWTTPSIEKYRATGFYDPASPEFAEEFHQVRRMGGADSSIRTAEQSEIALFWEDGPWGITPPGHFIYIAVQVLQHKEMTFTQLAQSFALLGMTQCDASICSWDNKYHFDIIRPETAIRTHAKQFNNTDTRVQRQKGWRSYIPTPPFPAYTSGHSTFGATAMKLLALINGADKVSISGRSPDLVLWPTLRGVTRYWTSLSQIAEENGYSRLYGGVHWKLDHSQAMKSGESIAKNAFQNIFQAKS